MSKELKYDVGKIFDSINYGKFKIINIDFETDTYRIKFLNTGFEKDLKGTNGIKLGLVRDDTISNSNTKYNIGDIYEGHDGKLFKIVDSIVINGDRKIKIKFIKSGYETIIFPSNIPNKSITDKSDKTWCMKHKIGDIIVSKKGVKGKILDIEHRKQSNGRIRTYLIIEILETGFVICATSDNFKRDRFKDLLKPSLYNVGKLGYIDDIVKENNCLLRDIKEYRIWEGIIHRCYGIKDYSKKNSSYENASISEEWLRFDKFYQTIKDVPYYEWWKRFKLEYPNTKNIFELDKDTLIKGNKIYSKDTCVFIPKFINAGYTSWAFDETKESLLKRMENMTYESIIEQSKQLRYI